jgi:hypothetical protein
MSGINSTIDQIVSSVSGISSMMSGFDGTLSTTDTSISPIMKIVTLGVTAFFGVFIGLGVLGIIGAILMTFCDKFSCRYLVYFVCVILLILGILSFLLSIVFSVITPILYLGCDFLTVTVGSSTGFNTNLSPLLDPSIVGYIKVCMPGGTGDLINALGVDVSAINGLTSSVSQLQAFDVSLLQTGVSTALTTLSTFIDQYYYTDLFDFTATATAHDKNFMIKISTASNYPGCAINAFNQDSWVPSIRQTDIPCQVSTSTASSTQCTSSADIQGGRNTSTSCFGCIDSMKVLLNTVTQSADINARYGTAGDCGLWAADMNNLWTNYYNPKKTAYDPVRTRMTATITQYNLATTGYHDRLNTVGTSFTTIINSLNQAASSVVDPQYGLVAGLNCLLLG